MAKKYVEKRNSAIWLRLAFNILPWQYQWLCGFLVYMVILITPIETLAAEYSTAFKLTTKKLYEIIQYPRKAEKVFRLIYFIVFRYKSLCNKHIFFLHKSNFYNIFVKCTAVGKGPKLSFLLNSIYENLLRTGIWLFLS